MSRAQHTHGPRPASRRQVQHAIADIVSDVRGLSVDETPYGVFFNQLTGAQHQQVVTAVGYRDRQAMVPDLRIHGLEGRGPSYFELKLLRASRSRIRTDSARIRTDSARIRHGFARISLTDSRIRRSTDSGLP